MYNSMFGAGSGSTAFAYDMMVLDDIKKQNAYCSYEEKGLKPCECTALDCEDCEYYEED